MEQETDQKLRELIKKAPGDLPEFFLSHTEKEVPLLPRDLFHLLGCWVQGHSFDISSDHFMKVLEWIRQKMGIQTALNALSYLEIVLGVRKPSIGMYDHAFHFIGGAQKYGCTIASVLQNDFDITLISNKMFRKEDLEKWYGLDLSKCRLKTVSIPFFEDREEKRSYIEPGVVDLKKDNPFHVVSRESGFYDVFINNSMVEMVYPLSAFSLFICHFPEREISRYFYVGKYSEIVYNSLYTAEWIKKRWSIVPHMHIYPPVDMEPGEMPYRKENIILSASRFDPGGNKQQAEIIKTFVKLVRMYPEMTKEWKLVVVGGSADNNPYLKKIQKIATRFSSYDIEIKVNITVDELRSIYEKAKIFWHLTGLNQEDPAKVEHFGMTIVEAMQNGNIPFVFNGGGQKEIVEEGKSGFLVDSSEELIEKTLMLLKDPGLQKKLSFQAFQEGKKFNKKTFSNMVKTYFYSLMEGFYPPC